MYYKYPYFASLLCFRCEGNPIITTKNSTIVGEDCAPWTDSFLSLKYQIAKLDNMELIDGKERELNKTDDKESLN
jgi:hypothetical protein